MSLSFSKNQGLVIVGASGGIASGFFQLAAIQKIQALGHIISLVTSKSFVEGADVGTVIDRFNNEILTKKEKSFIISDLGTDYENLIDYFEHIVNDLKIEPVLIDLTNGNLLKEHLYFSNKGYKVVSANKIPLAISSLTEFKQLVGPYYGGSTTVMGGQGIYGDVQDNYNAELGIKSIKGVFSGTMGLVMSELANGRKLSAIIKEAMDEGYTEPNPMDDLDGFDVAKKLVILARLGGYSVNIEDVTVEGLLGNEYRKFFDNGITDEAKKKFLEAIEQNEDEKFKLMALEAAEAVDADGVGKVLRFIADIQVIDGNVDLQVGISQIGLNEQIGQLSGNGNIAVRENEIDTKTLIGPGAGISVTAGNVLKDLCQILHNS